MAQNNTNIKAFGEIVDNINANNENKYFDKSTAKKITNLFYKKCIDRALKGHKIKLMFLGEFFIVKRPMKLTHWASRFKDINKYLHGYYYFVKFNNQIFSTKKCKYYTHIDAIRYIRDKAIENNLDFPLYTKI